MNTTTLKLVCSCLMCAPLLTACGGTHINTSTGAAQPQGTHNMSQSSDQQLASMTWKLNSIQDSKGVRSTLLKSGDAASRYQVTIKDGRIGVSGGCNIMGGDITLGQGNSFSVGPMMSTKRACMGTLMQSDNEISQHLRKASSYTLNGQTLSLTTEEDYTLNFTGIMTDEARYGAPGVRKFIELTNTKQGIQWREAKYDSNWIRIKDNAPWQSNFPGIKGFTPEMDMKYIVRLHEYTNPTTKKAIWVKDMVTMSGIIQSVD